TILTGSILPIIPVTPATIEANLRQPRKRLPSDRPAWHKNTSPNCANAVIDAIAARQDVRRRFQKVPTGSVDIEGKILRDYLAVGPIGDDCIDRLVEALLQLFLTLADTNSRFGLGAGHVTDKFAAILAFALKPVNKHE